MDVQATEGAAQSAIQYFENMRNFLVAVGKMKLLTFEASDLEKVSISTGYAASFSLPNACCVYIMKWINACFLNGALDPLCHSQCV